MTEQQIAGCVGKEAFASFQLAQSAAKRRRATALAPLMAYRCPICHKVHVGRNAKMPDKRKDQSVKSNMAQQRKLGSALEAAKRKRAWEKIEAPVLDWSARGSK